MWLEECELIVIVWESLRVPQLRSHGKNLTYDLKGLTLRLWNVDEHENPSYEGDDCEEAEYSLQAKMVVHNWKRVRHNHVACPHCASTNTNAGASNSGRENLRAQDVGDGTKASHECADEDGHADEGDQGRNEPSGLEKIHQHK